MDKAKPLLNVNTNLTDYSRKIKHLEDKIMELQADLRYIKNVLHDSGTMDWLAGEIICEYENMEVMFKNLPKGIK